MKKLIFTLLAVACMAAACSPPRGNRYPRVTVEVTFLDGTKDTMTISERYRMSPEGDLEQTDRQYEGPRGIAIGVKYVKELQQ